MNVANEIKDYLSSWAEKLGISKEGRITNYITHIFGEDIKSKSIPEELERIAEEMAEFLTLDEVINRVNQVVIAAQKMAELRIDSIEGVTKFWNSSM